MISIVTSNVAKQQKRIESLIKFVSCFYINELIWYIPLKQKETNKQNKNRCYTLGSLLEMRFEQKTYNKLNVINEAFY